MNNEQVPLSDINDICRKYDVKFSIETNGTSLIYYVFGPIRWAVVFGEAFSTRDFFEVVQRLAAKYPEKVEKF